MRTLSFILLLLSFSAFSQTITSTQQKALNSYVEYANQSAQEVSAVVKRIVEYYPTIHRKSSWGVPRYTCPVQMEEYYLTQVGTLSKSLSAAYSTSLNTHLKALRAAAEKIDINCKALDTYHKLEDYKQDNFAKAELLISELQGLLRDYKTKQVALQAELEAVFKKLNVSAPDNAYRKADGMLRAQVTHERALLDSWTFNLKEEVHTGWPVDKLEQSILDTDNQLATLKKFKPVLQYPASSMWPSFLENLTSVLEVKRSGLDGYNFEAKKSDGYSNEVYLSLINYFNGTLVADYNTFIQFAERDNYRGLKFINYFPLFEIRAQVEVVRVDVQPFKDIPRSPVAIETQKTAVTKTTYSALLNYVDFINETWRQVTRMQSTLTSFNSSASYYKTLESYDRVGGMSFEYKDFNLPLSAYQKVVADSKVLTPTVSKTLNEQAEVLLNILKEMNDLGASLEINVAEKQYEKDRLKRVYEILERQKVLFELWDQKKELLYRDVRKVFDAYPPASPASSWYISGMALRNLTDLGHAAVLQAKAYFRGDLSVSVSTEKIDQTLREVIAKEYDNMKGIEKIGRYNGLCPYNPYEDLPESSKSLSEALNKMKTSKGTSRYEHPYYRIQYHYNDIVDDYNKFCELSKDVLLLKTIKEPELFKVEYPKPKTSAATPSSETSILAASVAVTTPPATQTQTPAPRADKQTTTVQHDTIYIERRDTVYLTEPGENLRSMEGYATNNMILLLDVSGSMNTPEKLPLLKKSVLDMLSMMRSEDEVSIVAFSGKPKVLLEGSSFKEESKIKKAIDDLKPSGKTDGNAAVKLAYKVADENYVRGGNNRIILATDGEFVLNDETRQLIEKFSKEDIFLTIFNFGKGAGASKALQNLATLGKGNYEYISKENVEVKLIREAKAKKKK